MSEHPIVPAGMPIEEATAKIIDAAGKGRLALLVTDAAGNVIIGLKATGGLTELRPDGEGRWLFAGAFGGYPEVLEGSVALRNALGTQADQTSDDFGDPADDPVRAVVPLPELEPGYVPMPDRPPRRELRAGMVVPELPRRVPDQALERARNPLGLPLIPRPEDEP